MLAVNLDETREGSLVAVVVPPSGVLLRVASATHRRGALEDGVSLVA